MKILFVTNIPSPYRVDFFNELGKKCDLTVAFEKGKSDERDKSWENYRFETFCGVFLRGKAIDKDTAICPGILKYVSDRSYDEIIIANISSPTCIIAVMYLKAHSIPYWIEGDGAFAKPGNGIKNRIKTFMIRSAKGCFSTSKAHDEYYLAYGATEDRIHRYPFTSINEQYLKMANALTVNRNTFREKLGIFESKIVLSVGRFSYRNGYGKGFDLLMRIAKIMGDEYGFYIVGDSPTEEFISWKENEKLDNVHFVSYLNKEDLSEYYASADCFVLLTRGDAWGLVINEAMAYRLPIITTPYCVAGTELVEDGVNGYIVDIDDLQMIVKRIEEITESDNRDRLGICSCDIVSGYTIEKMAEVHMRSLEY